jgi:sterol desaturase/sphingolipid hydroxylase (fatty acid hydroxylase superfamily)
MAQQILGSMWAFICYVVPPMVLGVSVGTLVELQIPGEKQTWNSRVKAVPIWCAFILIGLTAREFIQFVLGTVHFHSLVMFDLRRETAVRSVGATIATYTVFPLLGFLVYDLLYYWLHRIFHTRTFWRVHAVHHSIEELNVVNDYHHWLEDLLKAPFILVPISLMVRVDHVIIVICLVTVRFFGHMTHANSKISYGIFRYVITEPRYHRIHHSVEQRHLEKNFAFMFPFWDVVFGTAYFPSKEEYPKTGVADEPPPDSVWSYLIFPFRKRKTSQKPDTTECPDEALTRR